MGKEGKKVREAYDGPTITYEQFVEAAAKFNAADSERASDAAASRGEIGQFIDETGLNKKVFSWGRQILRMKKETDQQDAVISLKKMVDFLDSYVLGNGTKAMDLEQPDNIEDAEGVETVPTGADGGDDETEAFNGEVDEAMGQIHEFNPGEVKLPGDGDEAA